MNKDKQIYEKSLLKKVSNVAFRTIPMHIIMLLTSLLPHTTPTTRLRGFLMKPFFKKCGRNFKLASGAIINQPQNIEIGDNVYIANNTWINGSGGITLKDNVVIGPMCVLVTTQHMFIRGKVSNVTSMAPIVIGENSWLASHVVVTDGVVIGEGTLIAAGGVVTKDIESYSLAGGVPAKIIKSTKNNM